MYEAAFYTPEDHAHIASEEYLAVYTSAAGAGEAEAHAASLGHCLADLNLWSDLPQSPVHRAKIVREVTAQRLSPGEQGVLQPVPLAEWHARARYRIDGVQNGRDHRLSAVKSGWSASPDVLEEILVGQGQGLWIVIRWYSTA